MSVALGDWAPETMSVAEQLATLPEEERKRFELSLSKEHMDALRWDWDFWARPDQQVPDDCSIYVRSAGRGSGKSLAIDTPIPIPGGWTTIGELRVGDEVYDESGSPCRVIFATGTRYGRSCYRVEFSDGSSVVADGDHRWLTETAKSRKAAGRAAVPRSGSEVRTTDQIARTLTIARGARNHSVQVAGPLYAPHVELPIDPYVLGVWLGDGSSKDAAITVADDDLKEMVDHLTAAGVSTFGKPRRKPGAKCVTLPFGRGAFIPRDPATGRLMSNEGMWSALKALGVWGNKHVPATYLRASIDQREALLQGLMDTDGTNCSGNVEFDNTNEGLADAVFELVVSLGWQATRGKKRAMLNGIDHGVMHRVIFNPDRPVFRLTRKRVLQRTPGGSQACRRRRRFITAVVPVPSVPVRCLTVDSPSHLFLAGRSMIPTHNTREGSEWARRKGPRHAEGLFIGANPRDARDLMIEGRSGVCSISPPWERPVYEPTKLLLRWPNGAIAHVRSAEDPGGIRGLSVEWVWCFPAGTMVTTSRGQVPIEQVKAGDRVLTRKGYKRVEKSLNRMATEMATLTHSEGVLRATPEHPIWTTRGWVPMRDLRPGDTIATCPDSLIGTASVGTSTGRTATTATAGASSTTERSTSIITGRSLTTGTSTTATRTAPTTTSATSRPSPPQIISPTTRTGVSRAPQPSFAGDGQRAHGSGPESGTSPACSVSSRLLVVPTGRIPMPSSALPSVGRSPSSAFVGVSNVAAPSSLPRRTARAYAAAGTLGPGAWSTPSASCVTLPSGLAGRGTVLPQLAPARVLSVSVGSTDERVYDLKVEGAHEFLADGVLAHNCDEIVKWRFLQETWDQSRLALREGAHPQTVVTTTPMPLPLIKKLLKGGRGIVVRPPVSTYRNAANLSPDYLRELLENYEGTRLGDQELHAIVLDDVKGALWTWALIEGSRWEGEFIETPTGLWVPNLSGIRRRVVGVDPSGSSTGDECGIVVVGTDGRRPPCGFVLDDRSKRGTPEEWGRAAVMAYYDHNCESMVAEVNYGAEMVERVIRTIPAQGAYPSGENVRFKALRAGKGQSKYERAIPVVGLFEQNLKGFRRVYMVGVYKELEGQMTTWIAPERADGIEVFKSNWSPDRMDAMVWGLLELLVIGGRRAGRAEGDVLRSASIG